MPGRHAYSGRRHAYSAGVSATGPARVATATPGLSDAARVGVALTSWGNALLEGRVPPDDVSDLAGDGREHRVVRADTVGDLSADGQTDLEETGLAYALARLRSEGVTRLRLVLPTPGDALGLAGPPALTQSAVAAGAAVVTVPGLQPPRAPRLALVPVPTRAQVVWRAAPAADGGDSALPDLPSAERALKEGLIRVTEELATLDVARSDPQALAALSAVRDDPRLSLAPGHPGRAVRVAVQACRLLAILEIALGGEGGAITRGEIAARRSALADLARSARHALAAAASATNAGAGAT